MLTNSFFQKEAFHPDPGLEARKFFVLLGVGDVLLKTCCSSSGLDGEQ